MFVFFFFKQKTAYEMRISDWSSDVCSSDHLYDQPTVTPPFRSGKRFFSVGCGGMAFKILPARSVGRGTARSVVEGKYAGCAPFPPPCFAWSPSPSLDGEESDRSAFLDRKSTRLNSSH